MFFLCAIALTHPDQYTLSILSSASPPNFRSNQPFERSLFLGYSVQRLSSPSHAVSQTSAPDFSPYLIPHAQKPHPQGDGVFHYPVGLQF
ncbi:MAG: hypothetical protein V7K50_21920 [Nostoc sp.]|uniref:hypothetical protein n=1 Tax=Nostoc sp. TaxID=1180 RepID=UPI002FF871B8